MEYETVTVSKPAYLPKIVQLITYTNNKTAHHNMDMTAGGRRSTETSTELTL
jgi:hypothetical protein